MTDKTYKPRRFVYPTKLGMMFYRIDNTPEHMLVNAWSALPDGKHLTYAINWHVLSRNGKISEKKHFMNVLREVCNLLAYEAYGMPGYAAYYWHTLMRQGFLC